MTLRATYPRFFRTVDRPVSALGRIGDHTLFYGRALAGAPFAATPRPARRVP